MVLLISSSASMTFACLMRPMGYLWYLGSTRTLGSILYVLLTAITFAFIFCTRHAPAFVLGPWERIVLLHNIVVPWINQQDLVFPITLREVEEDVRLFCIQLAENNDVGRISLWQTLAKSPHSDMVLLT